MRHFSANFDASQELLTTPKTSQGAQALYDRWASTYDNSLQDWGYNAPANTARIASFAAGKVGISKGEKLYDAGCGTGMVGGELGKYGFSNLVGSDISSASLALVEQKKPGLYQELSVCDLEKPLPFRTGSFSFICCVGVLSYVTDFDILWEEFVRVAVKGGLVIFTHNAKYWEEDLDGIQSKVLALEGEKRAARLAMTEPMNYMPHNPIESERQKRIRYFVIQVGSEAVPSPSQEFLDRLELLD